MTGGGAAELRVLWAWLIPPKSKLSDLGKALNGAPPPVDRVRPEPIRKAVSYCALNVFEVSVIVT